MRAIRIFTTSAALAALTTTSFFAYANSRGDERQPLAVAIETCDGTTESDERRPPRQPPAIAIEACDGLTEGAACSFEGRRGETVEGQCATLGDVLACKPDRPPPRRGGRDGQDRPGGDDRPDGR